MIFAVQKGLLKLIVEVLKIKAITLLLHSFVP
jgi:hypothetical protein